MENVTVQGKLSEPTHKGGHRPASTGTVTVGNEIHLPPSYKYVVVTNEQLVQQRPVRS